MGKNPTHLISVHKILSIIPSLLFVIIRIKITIEVILSPLFNLGLIGRTNS
jgi:hypothetical protein